MNSNEEKVSLWLSKINEAEKGYREYYELVDECREFYKDQTSARGSKYNIFWSCIETLKPFLYFKQPKFYIERQNKSADKAANLACFILERALEWNLAQFDFDSVIKYARNDFLISGCGILWEQYRPVLAEVANPENADEMLLVKVDETVETSYVDPKSFLADCTKVGVWEDALWVGRKIYLSASQIVEMFGVCLPDALYDDAKRDICVYEIWDKSSKQVYWLAKEYAEDFLRVSDDLWNVQGFFPCPKPIFATMTNDSIIPVPDYSMIKEMLNELNGLNERMKMTMQALKVSGCYDNSFPELADILSKDVTLVSVSDFGKLRESGGIRAIMEFAPIEQYVLALEQLAQRRQDVVSSIFDITGVSDIMRGSSNGAETATAVIKKTNFGTLRNQDRQNDMQRFIKDVLKIKAEIICEHFSNEKLVSFLSEEQKQDAILLQKAISIIKNERMRGMVFKVETDAVFNQQEENQATIAGVELINNMINFAFSIVSQQPLLLPLYKVMIQSIVSTLPKTRYFESTLEKVFNDIEDEMKKPPMEQQNPAIALEMQKNMLKIKELEVKQNIENNRLEFENRQLQAKVELKEKQMALDEVR